MAISKLKINFGQQLIIGSTVSFILKTISTGVETPITFTWVGTRSNPYEVNYTVGLPLGKSPATSFKQSFEIDQPLFPITLNTATELGELSSVLITSYDEDITFSGGTSIYKEGVSSAFITFEITREEDILVEGISESNYFLNNEIWIDLSVFENIDRYQVDVENSSNGKKADALVFFSNNGKASFNIQQIFKSLFDLPNVKNSNKFKIIVKAILGNVVLKESTFYKNIIRGGQRTEKTNISINFNTILRPTLNIPIWTGYPTQENYLSSDGSIQEQSPTNPDYRKENNCNGLYFKFLNQFGGYSNWLFQSFQESESNMPLGAFSSGRTIQDLGNESNCALSVYSKVPAEYYPLIKDLIISPEIYIWKNFEWVRVFSGRNSTESDLNKKAYAVKLKFDYENRFNSSLLW